MLSPLRKCLFSQWKSEQCGSIHNGRQTRASYSYWVNGPVKAFSLTPTSHSKVRIIPFTQKQDGELVMNLEAKQNWTEFKLLLTLYIQIHRHICVCVYIYIYTHTSSQKRSKERNMERRFLLLLLELCLLLRWHLLGFIGGPAVKTLPPSTGDMGSIPSGGRSHMPGCD